jgi:hypothetical protein
VGNLVERSTGFSRRNKKKRKNLDRARTRARKEGSGNHFFPVVPACVPELRIGNIKFFFRAFCILSSAFILSSFSDPVAWQESLRSGFLKRIDEAFSLLFTQEARSFPVSNTAEKKSFKNSDSQILSFEKEYGFFSDVDPIVGRVRGERKDLLTTITLLKTIYEKINDPFQCELMTAEVVSKVLAYRDLREGHLVQMAAMGKRGKVELVSFIVDKVFDLWHGMPAFGLVPQEKGSAAPLLLFRGTDLSITSERGWASIMSDLEMQDPGFSAFYHGKEEVHAWLEKVAKNGKKARVMGVSLGGIFVFYTLLYEKELINNELSSFSFNAPGISRELLQDWSDQGSHPPFWVLVTQGDAIPKYGRLPPKAYLLFNGEKLGPIDAHTRLITLSPSYFLQAIDTKAENEKRRK